MFSCGRCSASQAIGYTQVFWEGWYLAGYNAMADASMAGSRVCVGTRSWLKVCWPARACSYGSPYSSRKVNQTSSVQRERCLGTKLDTVFYCFHIDPLRLLKCIRKPSYKCCRW